MSELDFKFDLQLFADGGDDSGQDDAGGADDADTLLPDALSLVGQAIEQGALLVDKPFAQQVIAT